MSCKSFHVRRRIVPPAGMRMLPLAVASVVAGMPFMAGEAQAFEIEGGDDVRMRFDNTVKYTAAWRLKNADGFVANQDGGQPNTDFGDLGFKKGLINNRLDILSEFDLAYRNVGLRISGAGWYDAEYAGGRNDYPSAAGGLPNYQGGIPGAMAGGANDRLPEASRDVMGRYAEFGDAFVYGKFELGEQTLSLRAGRHTLIYGESLFLGANAIAAAQGPVDLVKALSLPNVQFKEVARPVNQVSGSLSLSENVSIGGYLQFQWKEHRLPAAGSYFSGADFVGPGADLLIHPFAAMSPGGSPFASRGRDYKGSHGGQWGLQLKVRAGDVDYGIYAAHYDDKAPIAVVNVPSIATGSGRFGGGVYNLMYAKDISVYGVSASTVVGGINVAGELSTRRNVPLVVPGDLILNTSVASPDNDRNTPYARGNSLHLNLSAISVLPGNSLWDAASVVAEFAFNRVLGVTHRPAQDFFSSLNATHTRDASAMRVVFQPEFFQVVPSVDLQVPIGLGYGLGGRSAVVSLSPERGGDFSIGINATIDRTWQAGLNYTRYFGEAGAATSVKSVGPYASYQQYYKDRDFIAFSIQRTF